MRILLAFLRRDALVEASYRTNLALGLVSALVALLSTWYLGVAVGHGSPALQAWGGDYFAFTTVGVAIAAPLAAGLSGFSNQVRDAQIDGTLEPMLLAPISAARAVVYQAAFGLLWACVRALAFAGGAIVVFGVPTHAEGLPLALLGAALGLGIYLALGMISAAFTLLLKRGEPVAWAVQQASVLLGGVLFPIEVLPAPLRAAADVLPLTHTLTVVRGALLLGQGAAEVERSLAVLAASFAVLAPLAAMTFQWAIRRAQQDGSLSHQ